MELVLIWKVRICQTVMGGLKVLPNHSALWDGAVTLFKIDNNVLIHLNTGLDIVFLTVTKGFSPSVRQGFPENLCLRKKWVYCTEA